MRFRTTAALAITLLLAPLFGVAQSRAQLDEKEAEQEAAESLQELLTSGEKRSQRMLGDLEHRSPERRAEAARYLGDRREKGAVTALIPLLEDGSPEVRNQAARALWRIGKPTVVAAKSELEALLAIETDGDATINATGALWRIGNPTAELRPHLEPVLDDDSGYVRLRAADLLLKLGAAPGTLLATYDEAFDTGSDKLRHYAVKLLSDHDDTPADFAPLMVRALKDPQETVRILAAVELNLIGAATPAVLAALHEATGDPSETVRSTVLIALSRLDPGSGGSGSSGSPPPATDKFLAGLGDPKATVRAQAARSLGETGSSSPQVAAALVAALGDQAQEVRAAAAESLGTCGGGATAVIPALWARWNDSAEHWTVRHAAGRALGALGETVDWEGEG